jgi:hypothetical protein
VERYLCARVLFCIHNCFRIRRRNDHRKETYSGSLERHGAGWFAVTASAAIVCNGDVCWHTHERYTYPHESGVVIHEDGWRPGPNVTIREHEGRGYWRGESWETLPDEGVVVHEERR